MMDAEKSALAVEPSDILAAMRELGEAVDCYLDPVIPRSITGPMLSRARDRALEISDRLN